MSEEFSSARTNPLKPHLRWIAIVLDNLARSKPYCWAKNEALAEEMGLGLRQVKSVLAELEAAGWILRLNHPTKDKRYGFVMLCRTHPDSPVWPRDRPIEEAIAEIEQRKCRGKIRKLGKMAEGEVECPLRVQPSAPSRDFQGAVECPLKSNKDELGTKDESKKNTPLPPKGAPEGGARLEQTDEIPFPQERQEILRTAGSFFRSKQVAEIVRNWRGIVRRLGSRRKLEYFNCALLEAGERPLGNPVNHPATWCLEAAANAVASGAPPNYSWERVHGVVTSTPVSHPIPV